MIIKKNILIWYWGRFGYQKQTLEMINELQKINKNKKKFNFFYSYSTNAELVKKYQRLKIKQFPIQTFKNFKQAAFRTLVISKLRKNFLSFIKKEKIDYIFCPMFHYWNPYFSLKFKSMNIKYIFAIHDYKLHDGENNFIEKKIYEVEKKNADKYVCYSKFVYKQLVRNKIKKKNILLSSLEYKNRIFLKTNKIKNIKFVFFGRFVKYKGIHKLIKIFSKSYYVKNNISLTLIGRKNNDFKLPQIKTQNINIIDNWIEEHKIDKTLKKYDVCIMPYEEASQSGVIQIMFRNSIPVIVTPVGALSDQVKNNFNSLVTKNKTITSIENEIRKIMNLKLFYKLRKNAVKSATLNNKNFSKRVRLLYDFLN